MASFLQGSSSSFSGVPVTRVIACWDVRVAVEWGIEIAEMLSRKLNH